MNDNANFDIYPNRPGWKGQETSALAAEFIAETAPILRARCLKAFEAAPMGLTGNELAEALKHDVMSVRPRISELLRMGKVRNSGIRRPTGSGCTAIVWVVADENLGEIAA